MTGKSDAGVWRYPYEEFQTGPRKGQIGPSNTQLEHAVISRASVLMFFKPAHWDYVPLGLVRVVEANRDTREFTVALTPVAPVRGSMRWPRLRRCSFARGP